MLHLPGILRFFDAFQTLPRKLWKLRLFQDMWKFTWGIKDNKAGK